jgi:hypothetical protein
LLSVYKLHQPEYLFTAITSSPSSEYVQDYIHALSEKFPSAHILVTGYQVLGQDLSFPANVSQMSYIRDIKDLLEELDQVYQEK